MRYFGQNRFYDSQETNIAHLITLNVSHYTTDISKRASNLGKLIVMCKGIYLQVYNIELLLVSHVDLVMRIISI